MSIGRQNLLLFIILGLALSFRIHHMFYGPALSEQIWSDMQAYVQLSDDIAADNWHPNLFFQSVGYPYLLYVLKRTFTDWGFVLNLLQALASFATLIPVYSVTRATFGTVTAFIALVLASFHMNWVLISDYALPETFFTLLLSLNAWFSYQLVTRESSRAVDALMWGLTFILAFWLKGTHALLGPLFVGGLFFYQGIKSIKAIVLIALVVGSGTVAHGILTYNKIGKFQITASTKGLNLVEGKCPSKINEDSLGYSWQSPLYKQLGLNEFRKWDRPFTDSDYFTQQGLECIRKKPWVLVQSFEAIPFLFIGNTSWPLNVSPFKNKIRLYELFFAVIAIVGLVACFRWLLHQQNKKQIFLIWFLPVISLFLCVYIFKSEMRYRIPFDVWIIPLSVKGWIELLQCHSLKPVK